MSIPQVALAGDKVSQIGLGLMQLTWAPSPPSEDKAFAAMKAAIDAAGPAKTAISSATFYGNPGDPFANLRLIGAFVKKYPEYKDKLVLILKGGVILTDKGPNVTNDLEENRRLLATAQQHLGDMPIHVYSPARMLPGADPVEYFAAFDELRKEGLFGRLGVSELSAATTRKLQAVYDIAVTEVEVSLWSYEQEIQDVIALSTATGLPVLAYSPLGRGFITRTWKTPEDIPAGSFQAQSPRFQGDNFYHNLRLVDALDAIAARRGITTAQLAISWVAGLGPNIIPIPGSSNPERARQNVESGAITISKEEHAEIEAVLSKFELKGGRYPASHATVLML